MQAGRLLMFINTDLHLITNNCCIFAADNILIPVQAIIVY